MDLADILYIINGSLEVTLLSATKPGGESVYEAVLYDTIHDPCMLRGKGLKPESNSEWRYAQARITGPTEQAALGALAGLIAGTMLGHDSPVMYTSSTSWLRIPPAVAVGSPPINIRRPYAPPEEPDTETAPEGVAPI